MRTRKSCKAALIGAEVQRSRHERVVTRLESRVVRRSATKRTSQRWTAILSQRAQERVKQHVGSHDVAFHIIREPGGSGAQADEIVSVRGERTEQIPPRASRA